MNYERPNYSIASIIICDETRQEANGKEILIGVYNQTLIVAEIPFTMRIMFRVSLTLKKNGLKNFSMFVRDPSGDEIFRLPDTPMPVAPVGEPLVCGVGVMNLTYKNAGKHTLFFGVEEPALPMLEFGVTLPRNDAEAQRIKA